MVHRGKAHRTKLHAQRRARERYGNVTPQVMRAIYRAIRKELRRTISLEDRQRQVTTPIENLDVFPEKGRVVGNGGDRQVWRVTVGANTYRVVWSRAARRVITFLQPLVRAGSDVRL